MDIKEAIRLVQADRIKLSENCGLCNRRADGVGIFAPKPEFAKKIGQREGETRLALYPSCSVCQENLGMDEYMLRIELVMQADTLADGKRQYRMKLRSGRGGRVIIPSSSYKLSSFLTYIYTHDWVTAQIEDMKYIGGVQDIEGLGRLRASCQPRAGA